tara:strand:+ start:1685 stop:1897 length:213 start_codon:yes stop_codon:yes gene_type:complete
MTKMVKRLHRLGYSNIHVNERGYLFTDGEYSYEWETEGEYPYLVVRKDDKSKVINLSEKEILLFLKKKRL